MFEKDTYERSLAFLVTETNNEIKALKKMNPKTQAGNELFKIYASEFSLNVDHLFEKFNLADHINKKEGILEKSHFINNHKEYLRLISLKEKNPKWYRLFGGPKNIEELAKHLEQKTLYELLYRKWSEPTHGGNSVQRDPIISF
jgi:hypothetical protein